VPAGTRLPELIGGIYDSVLRPETWPEVLDGIEQEIGAISSYLLIHGTHPSDRNLSILVERNVDAGMRRLYDEHYIKLNPLLPHLASAGSGEVYSCRHLVTQPEYLKSDFYHEWAEPQEWFDYAGVTIVRRDHASAAMGFTSGKRDYVFPDASLTVLNILAPHLVRASEIQDLFERERQSHRDLASIVEALRCGIVIVDSEARVMEANPAAEETLASNSGITVRNRVLAAGRTTTVLHGAIRIACGRDGPPCGATVAVKRGPGRRPLAVYVLPLSDPAGRLITALRPARAAVLIVDPERPAIGPLDGFASVYQLTDAEWQVLEHLAGGASPGEIARTLGVGVATVRTHLHRLFDKTGTRRQAELVALLLGSLPPVRMR
jgi:DNA-binding CsgD family transcriptional regulator/PAS domain-containing protein